MDNLNEEKNIYLKPVLVTNDRFLSVNKNDLSIFEQIFNS